MRATLALAAALSLAACGQNDTPADDVAATDGPDEAAPAITAPAPTPTPTPTDAVGIPEFGIPVALQGRWGMVPADCTSTRGDAKGLLGISATTLTFYESFARLGSIKNRSDTAIRADFSFTGEGMEWSREESLIVEGDTLTRTEKGGDEPGSGGPFTYTRCS